MSDTERLTIAALVVTIALGVLLAYALHRAYVLTKGDREKARPKKPPESRGRYDSPVKSDFQDKIVSETIEERKIEPRLFAGLEIDEVRPAPPSAPRREPDRDDHQDRGGFGFRGLTAAFVIGIGVGVLSGPWALQSSAPLVRSLIERMNELDQNIAAIDQSGPPQTAADDRSVDGAPADTAVSSVEQDAGSPPAAAAVQAAQAFVSATKSRLPIPMSHRIDLVDIDLSGDFLELRVDVSRSMSEQARALFATTSDERTKYFICDTPSNAELRALTGDGIGVRAIYRDSDGQDIAVDTLESPICANPLQNDGTSVLN